MSILNNKSKNILAKHKFIHKSNENFGYYYAITWENEDFIFSVACDRGFFEAFISAKKEWTIGGPLLFFLRRVLGKSAQIIEEHNLSDRKKEITANWYIELLDKYLPDIKSYSSSFTDFKLDIRGIDYLNLDQHVNKVNKFWKSVELRFSQYDSISSVVSQKNGSNLPESIFKLGQKVGSSIMHNSLKIKLVDGINDGFSVVQSNDSIKIQITSKFGIITLFKGILQSAESYMMHKIKNRMIGKYKDEALKIIAEHNGPPDTSLARIGYKTFNDNLLFFSKKNDKLNPIAIYKIQVEYD